MKLLRSTFLAVTVLGLVLSVGALAENADSTPHHHSHGRGQLARACPAQAAQCKGVHPFPMCMANAGCQEAMYLEMMRGHRLTTPQPPPASN